MEEKTYLKWHNKVGYGSGDIAGNLVYAFLSSFVMIYLTNTIGLNSGIVGTLIAVSKLFDGITDIFFGTMIDRTKSKMGKARPWMFYGFFGCAITLYGVFAIPTNMGKTAQYAWFFICYTLLNAVFYTANNIAYAALTSLVTKNSKERVQMGSFRFMFSFGTNLAIQSITVGAVELLGNGATAWRIIALSRLLVVFAGYMGSIPLMLLFIAMTSLGEGPWQGDMSAVIAQCSEYTYLKSGKRIDGSMFSCTSMGIKLGGGIGIALSGWLLDISGYINMDNAVQPASCIKMMYFMYLWLPFIFDIIITVILSFLNVEGANRELIENMQES